LKPSSVVDNRSTSREACAWVLRKVFVLIVGSSQSLPQIKPDLVVAVKARIHGQIVVRNVLAPEYVHPRLEHWLGNCRNLRMTDSGFAW